MEKGELGLGGGTAGGAHGCDGRRKARKGEEVVGVACVWGLGARRKAKKGGARAGDGANDGLESWEWMLIANAVASLWLFRTFSREIR